MTDYDPGARDGSPKASSEEGDITEALKAEARVLRGERAELQESLRAVDEPGWYEAIGKGLVEGELRERGAYWGAVDGPSLDDPDHHEYDEALTTLLDTDPPVDELKAYYRKRLQAEIDAIDKRLSRNKFADEFVSDQEQEPNLSQQIADKLRALGEEHGFDEETCDEIAQLPFEEAFETAYGYLVQAGFDPNEILAEFMEPTD